MKRSSGRMLWSIALLGVAGGGFLTWTQFRPNGSAVTYRTTQIAKGDLVSTITATGTLEPEEAIDVGAQVAGQISCFGTVDGKPIDRRSFVKAGELLAQIDPSIYKMELESVEAQLAQSKALLSQRMAQLAQTDAQSAQCDANIAKAQADIELTEAKKNLAEQDWTRAQKVGKESPDALSATVYDGFKANYQTSVASLAAAKAAKVQIDATKTEAKAAREQALAAIEQAKASILQTQASLKRAQRNLDYCTITSPVNGVVIDRRVNIGQTVVASLNAPSLFLIAKDLTRMQIWVSVNEADVGHIHNDQPVTFTVDARPGKTFSGTVTKVRFDATMTQNVVTYPVEVLALNPDGLLYPYMTTNVQFELDRRTNVWKVPNAALAYSPLTEEQIAPEFRPGAKNVAQLKTDSGLEKKKGVIWIQQGEFLRPISVHVGLSDGSMTDVDGPELKENQFVVLSEQRQAAPPAGTSPFVPQVRKK